MAKALNDKIFLFIGDQAFTLADLGPAADMRIDKAMQSIVDQGLLGQQYVGLDWFEVIKTSGLKMEAAPLPEETLQYSLYMDYQAELEKCRELNCKGELTQADKDAMMAKRRTFEAATKLAKP